MAINTGGGSRSRTSRRMSEINVTPMVDVMLVLLIIFMVTAPMMTAGVAVDLPQTSAKSLPGNDEPLVISIKSDGSIYIQESAVAYPKLRSKLSAIAAQNKEKRVFIRGDKTLNYGRMMEVMGEVDAAGFTRIAFVTESRSE